MIDTVMSLQDTDLNTEPTLNILSTMLKVATREVSSQLVAIVHGHVMIT